MTSTTTTTTTMPTRINHSSDSGCMVCEARGETVRAAYAYAADGLAGYVEACSQAHAAELVALERLDHVADARSVVAQKILGLLETCEAADVATVTSTIGAQLYLNVNAEAGLNDARATCSGGVFGAHTLHCAGLTPSAFAQRVLAHWEGYLAAQPKPLGELAPLWK